MFVAAASPTRHVGHMEQHPGAQKAAGLAAGAAAAATEGPGAAVCGYVPAGAAFTMNENVCPSYDVI